MRERAFPTGAFRAQGPCFQRPPGLTITSCRCKLRSRALSGTWRRARTVVCSGSSWATPMETRSTAKGPFWTRANWRLQPGSPSFPPVQGSSNGSEIRSEPPSPCPFSLTLPPQMLKGEIASVVWQQQGHRIEVNYVDGAPDYMQGDEVVVSQMAENEGMVADAHCGWHPAVGATLTPGAFQKWGPQRGPGQDKVPPVCRRLSRWAAV